MKINQRQAEKQILDALMKEASKRIARNRYRVQRDLERVLQGWVYNSPAVTSLEAEVFGSLKATFWVDYGTCFSGSHRAFYSDWKMFVCKCQQYSKANLCGV